MRDAQAMDLDALSTVDPEAHTFYKHGLSCFQELLQTFKDKALFLEVKSFKCAGNLSQLLGE